MGWESDPTVAASVTTPIPPPTVEPPVVQDPAEKKAQRDKDDAEYGKYRESIVQLIHETGKEVDKWILTLAGLAFGFSLSFVKDFLKPETALVHPWFLYASWLTFALCVALVLINLQTSYSAANKFKVIIDTNFEKYDQFANSGAFWNATRTQMNALKRNKLIEAFNWIGLIAFLLGIIFLITFAYYNVNREVKKHEQPKQTAATTGSATTQSTP